MTLTAAIQEAYANARQDPTIETIQITNPVDGASIYMCQQRSALDLTLEDATMQRFEPVPFRFTLPSTGENGRQDLTLEIDNIDRRISDFVTAVKSSTDPVEVRYRPYLASDMSTPQMNPPLLLTLKSVSLNTVVAAGKASFADVLNRKFLNQLYTRQRFKSLGN